MLSDWSPFKAEDTKESTGGLKSFKGVGAKRKDAPLPRKGGIGGGIGAGGGGGGVS